MKTKRNTWVLVAALTVTPALWAAMYSPTTLKALPDHQRSQGLDSFQSTQIERKNCVVQSVYAPALELVVVDESGAIRTETLSNAVVIQDGDEILAINELQPGDTITLVQNSNGEITRIAIVN